MMMLLSIEQSRREWSYFEYPNIGLESNELLLLSAFCELSKDLSTSKRKETDTKRTDKCCDKTFIKLWKDPKKCQWGSDLLIAHF